MLNEIGRHIYNKIKDPYEQITPDMPDSCKLNLLKKSLTINQNCFDQDPQNKKLHSFIIYLKHKIRQIKLKIEKKQIHTKAILYSMTEGPQQKTENIIQERQ